MQPTSDRPAWWRAFGAAHDGITRGGFALAMAMLLVIVVSYCYEIVARYAFDAPTLWASPLVSYCLVVLIFLAMPELTRGASHIAINVLIDAAPPELARWMRGSVRVVAAAACFLATWFCADESLRQFSGDIWTSPPFALPKWTVSMFIPFGMASSGLYFLRQLVDEPVAVTEVQT